MYEFYNFLIFLSEFYDCIIALFLSPGSLNRAKSIFESAIGQFDIDIIIMILC